jgi:hypothetical protein
MNLDRLVEPEKPWLHLLVMGETEACDLLSDVPSSPQEPVVTRVMRGHKGTTAADLFDEFAAALQFPCYFGENWDAFDECLTDLEWLPADAYVLLITRTIHLLEREPSEHFRQFLNILVEAGQTWSQPAEGQWPRPPRAFHVILQCASAEEKPLRERLKAAGAAFDVLS